MKEKSDESTSISDGYLYDENKIRYVQLYLSPKTNEGKQGTIAPAENARVTQDEQNH